MFNKKLILFFLTICSQIHGMDEPFHPVFGNKDLVEKQIIPYCSFIESARLKQVCKDLDEMVKKPDRLKHDYVFFFDYYNPPVDLPDDQNTLNQKKKLLDTLIPIHEKRIEEDIVCYRKLFYTREPLEVEMKLETIKAFILGEDLHRHKHLFKRSCLADIWQQNNYCVTLRHLDRLFMTGKGDITGLLGQACFGECPNTIKALLKRGAYPNRIVVNGVDTPLSWSCLRGYTDNVKVLLQGGADPDLASIDHQTPLYLACYNGHPDIIAILLQHGTDPNKRSIGRYTPFYAVCTSYDYCHYTLREYPPRNNPPYAFCKLSDPDRFLVALEILFENGLDLNLFEQTNCISPFFSHNYCYQLIPILIKKHGVDPNLRIGGYGNTLLHSACQNDNKEIAQLCLEKGALINQHNTIGYTPLYWACKGKNPNLELVQLLLENNADPNLLNNNETNETVLDLANWKHPENKPLKNLLLQHGARTSFYLSFTNFLHKARFAVAVVLAGTFLWYKYKT